MTSKCSKHGLQANASGQMTDPVPLITIGGFLGAGKTTLVNHLLSQSEGQRIVVFVNDFGAINIDYDLIETADANRVSLKNGCVCCSLNDDLIAAIVGFCQDDPPDAFVVEASGVADPRALDASIFLLQRAGHVLLDNRVYLVDAENFGAMDYADTEAIVDHAAASDLLVINKSDLVTVDTMADLEHLFMRSAPRTNVVRAMHGKIPLSVLLGSKLSRPTVEASIDRKHVSHGDQYQSWSQSGFSPLTSDQLDFLIAKLKACVFRAKGILRVKGSPDETLQFDLVGSRVTFRKRALETTMDQSRIVAIGALDQRQLDLLDACLGMPPASVDQPSY